MKDYYALQISVIFQECTTDKEVEKVWKCFKYLVVYYRHDRLDLIEKLYERRKAYLFLKNWMEKTRNNNGN